MPAFLYKVFTDPGTDVDHFVIVHFILKHFFSGEIVLDWAERAGFRSQFRKCARGLFPGLRFDEKKITKKLPDFFVSDP